MDFGGHPNSTASTGKVFGLMFVLWERIDIYAINFT